jgi:hypothetical protein
MPATRGQGVDARMVPHSYSANTPSKANPVPERARGLNLQQLHNPNFMPLGSCAYQNARSKIKFNGDGGLRT